MLSSSSANQHVGYVLYRALVLESFGFIQSGIGTVYSNVIRIVHIYFSTDDTAITDNFHSYADVHEEAFNHPDGLSSIATATNLPEKKVCIN